MRDIPLHNIWNCTSFICDTYLLVDIHQPPPPLNTHVFIQVMEDLLIELRGTNTSDLSANQIDLPTKKMSMSQVFESSSEWIYCEEPEIPGVSTCFQNCVFHVMKHFVILPTMHYFMLLLFFFSIFSYVFFSLSLFVFCVFFNERVLLCWEFRIYPLSRIRPILYRGQVWLECGMLRLFLINSHNC